MTSSGVALSASRSHPDSQIDASRWALFLLLALFVILQITHAWVVDDAYITLRTVDNFVHGRGLRWNVAERVQSYTHPLWMFALSAVYAITREAFYSTLTLSLVTSLLAIFTALRSAALREGNQRPILFLAVLLGSKSFIDYSSSGLENPLTHLLLALFFGRFLALRVQGGEADPAPEQSHDMRKESAILFGLAALGFVNRMDTAVFFGPACVLFLYEARRQARPALIGALLGSLPALLWLAFSLFYYGMLLPNTAIAKLSGPRVTAIERVQAGIVYVVDSAMSDPLTLVACGVAIAVAISSRQPRLIAAATGVFAYLVYVVVAGAIGTHMSGRFFSGALLLSALILAREARQMNLALGACSLTALWMAASPVSPLRVGFDGYGVAGVDRGEGFLIDTRRFVLEEGAALLNLIAGQGMPRHPWYRAGLEYRKGPERVHVGGLVAVLAIGYSGFAAGPEKHFIDVLGLSDPLIARLPMPVQGSFRPGHFFRLIPDGYVASVEHDANLITDPDLREYYESLRMITRGSLWSFDRLMVILDFQLGGYDAYLDAYAVSHGLRPRS